MYTVNDRISARGAYLKIEIFEGVLIRAGATNRAEALIILKLQLYFLFIIRTTLQSFANRNGALIRKK